MKSGIRRTVTLAPAWLAFAAFASAQQERQVATPEPKESQGRAFSGRVIDGLGRPVPGMKVTVVTVSKGQEKATGTVLRTDDDGRYAGALPPGDEMPWLTFEKDGYSRLVADLDSGETTVKCKVDWDEATMLPFRGGEKLDRGVRELLASEEWENEDGELPRFLFKFQEEFRPALRRLIRDAHVGLSARDWLDLLNDPGDHDLFPGKRPYAPEKEVKEADLVEALKVTARQRNAFSTKSEPTINIDLIEFTLGLDRVLIQCGINRGPLTGASWQFVFRKVGKQWELLSAKQTGRG